MNSEKKLFTAGEFARLARTTKRTVFFYEEKGLLKPYTINESGYRLYKPQQIFDFQAILLLRKLNFSIAEIKKYLTRDRTLKTLFKEKRSTIREEVEGLKRALERVETYYDNLERTGTLVRPVVRKINAFQYYAIKRQGPYAKIREFCFELKGFFRRIPRDAFYFMFEESVGYRPKNASMVIGVVKHNGMVLRSDNEVYKGQMPSFQALVYHHEGTGKLLSLIWDNMRKYARINGLERNRNRAPLELYIATSLNGIQNEDIHRFKLALPIM